MNDPKAKAAYHPGDAPVTRPDLDALIERLNYEASEDRRISRMAKQKHTKATLDQRAEVSEEAAATLAAERARADQAEQLIADAWDAGYEKGFDDAIYRHYKATSNPYRPAPTAEQ